MGVEYFNMMPMLWEQCDEEFDLPWPTDANFLSPAFRKDTVCMGIKLNSITLLVAPLVFLTGVVKVHIARELFAKAECSRSLRLVLRPVKFGLDDEVIWAPRIGEVHILQVYCFKAVISTCIPENTRSLRKFCVSGYGVYW